MHGQVMITYKSLARPAKRRMIHIDIEAFVTAEGHTDNVGSIARNEKLSQNRAKAVKKYIVDKFGIDATRLSAKGYGPGKPVSSNTTKEGRQKNRRVEAELEYIVKK
jgi:OmpA-OmpF porin, OOP family